MEDMYHVHQEDEQRVDLRVNLIKLEDQKNLAEGREKVSQKNSWESSNYFDNNR
jgi:hypothetical protein